MSTMPLPRRKSPWWAPAAAVALAVGILSIGVGMGNHRHRSPNPYSIYQDAFMQAGVLYHKGRVDDARRHLTETAARGAAETDPPLRDAVLYEAAVLQARAGWADDARRTERGIAEASVRGRVEAIIQESLRSGQHDWHPSWKSLPEPPR